MASYNNPPYAQGRGGAPSTGGANQYGGGQTGKLDKEEVVELPSLVPPCCSAQSLRRRADFFGGGSQGPQRTRKRGCSRKLFGGDETIERYKATGQGQDGYYAALDASIFAREDPPVLQASVIRPAHLPRSLLC